MQRGRFLILVVLLFCRPWVCLADQASLPHPIPPLIQIGVEMVEIDQQKTLKFGIEWLNSILLNETAVPALLQVQLLRLPAFRERDRILVPG